MNLLVCTFVLDELHTALSWQVRVVRELAGRVDHVLVLTSLVRNDPVFPDNVDVVVPPRRPHGLPHRFGGLWAYSPDIFRLCQKHKIDAIFIHMAMDWSWRLYPIAKLLGLPMIFWYAHGTVTRRLKLASHCVDKIVTSTREGCRIDSDRVKIIGQAIDVERFDIQQVQTRSTVLYVGRISSRKRVDYIYQIASDVWEMPEMATVPFDIVGGPLSVPDLDYERNIRGMIWQDRRQDLFRIVGFVPADFIPGFYRTAFVHINLSQTGSMDKTVMEALACGCPVLTTNEAFFDVLSNYPEFLVKDDRREAIRDQLSFIYANRANYDPAQLRALVEHEHNMNDYADRVLGVLREYTDA